MIIGSVIGGIILVALIGAVVYLRMRATADLEPIITQAPSGPAIQSPVGGTPMDANRERLAEQERERLAAMPKDTDGDGLSNDEEKQIGSNPAEGDTDGDGYNDNEEVRTLKTDPTKPDEGGLEKRLADLDARLSSVSSTRQNAQSPSTVPQQPVTSLTILPDSDGDGLTSEQEASLDTDPNNPDTDADGLTDREEAETYKTNPILADTDGDSYADGSEVQSGYNPLGPGRCSRETCIP